MYIRPRQLWLLLPIFILLFLLGAALALLHERQGEDGRDVPVIDLEQRAAEDRDALAELLEPLEKKEQIPFTVKWQKDWLSGHFRGERFDLSGTVAGHQVVIRRDDSRASVTIDGEKQEPALLPFALYTPYEHARLVKGQLQVVQPLPLIDEQQQGLLGYQIALPAKEVKEMMALWLGPSFPVEETMASMDRQVAITYQFWYDANVKKLRQIVVHLALQTAQGKKQDQLTFYL
jgi:hypothetical protein